MGTMCVPSKTLWPTLKGCKWGYLVFHWSRQEPRALPRQKNSKCNSASFVMRISGSLLHRHLKEINMWYIYSNYQLNKYLNSLVFPLMVRLPETIHCRWITLNLYHHIPFHSHFHHHHHCYLLDRWQQNNVQT